MNSKKYIFLFLIFTLFFSLFSNAFAEGTEESPIGDYIVTYSTEGDTFIIRNTRSIDTVDITASKLWSDAEDQDGIRPREIKFQLKADGVNKGNPVIVSANNEGVWSYTWEDLPANRDKGIPIVYTVEEAEEVKGYTSEVSQDGLTVTNTHEPEMRELTVEWEWIDDNNRDGIRPNTAEVSVYLGETNYGDIVFDKNDTSSKTISVPKYTPGKSGVPAVYEAKIKTLDSRYTDVVGVPSSNADLKLEGHYDPKKISVNVTKLWNDNNNQDGKRLTSVTYALVTDGVEGDPVRAETTDFSHVWNNLYKYRDQGTEIQYSVIEHNTGDYTPSYECSESGEGIACVVTNTHTPANIDLNLTWMWNDDDDRDGKRQDNVTVEVFIGDLSVGTMTFEGAKGQETKTLSVPEYVPDSEGVRAEYAYVIHDLNSEYSDALNSSDPVNPVIIASYDPEKLSVRASKLWNDDNNRDNKRPEAITYALVTDNVQGDPVTVTKQESPDYTKIWNDLYKYHDKGTAYNYSVVELDSGEYTPSYNCQLRTYGIACTVTNSRDIETKELPIRLTWDDEFDRDDKRQDTVTVEVYLGDELIGTVEYSGNDETSVKPITVPVYKPDEVGVPAEYTYVVKDLNSEYEDTLNDSDKSAPEIIAKYIPEKTSVKVSKQWNDSNNQDGKRPASVTYALTIDGVAQEPVTISAAPLFENEWTNLYKYHDHGIEYKYGVVEQNAGEYIPTYNCEKTNGGITSCVVTNNRDIETKELPIRWTWDDELDRDGKRQDAVTVEVYLGDELIGTVEYSGNDETSVKPITVPVYKPGETGVPAEYTYVVTNLDSEYEDTLNNTDKSAPEIIAKYIPEKTSVKVSKQWNDSNNQDGKRPSVVTYALTIDGTAQEPVSVSGAPLFEHEWKDLYRYHNGGTEYVYGVSEQNAGEYTPSYNCVKANDGSTSCVVTNSRETDTKELKVTWKWDDDNDRDGERQDTVTVDVYLDGEIVGTITFPGGSETKTETLIVPENTPGKEGVPSEFTFVIRDLDDDYEDDITIIDSSTTLIVGSYDPKLMSVDVSKKWNDDDNRDGVRPSTVTWQLMKDGRAEGDAVTVPTENSSYIWNNLYVYRDHGVKYEYSVNEVNVDAAYSASSERSENGNNQSYLFTNSHNIEKLNVTPKIVWDDLDNQDGIRPETLTIRIIADNAATEITFATDEQEEWKHLFEELPKYNNGQEIDYAFEIIDKVNDYTYRFDPEDKWTVVYTHKPEERDFVAVVKWVDDKNQDGLRPNEVSVQLYANGEPVGDPQTVVSDPEATDKDAWQTEWTKLPRYSNGEQIIYTARQLDDLTPDYSTEIKDSEDQSVITNIHVRDTVDVPFIIVWDDLSNQDGLRPDEINVVIKENNETVSDVNLKTEEDVSENTFDDMIANRDGEPIHYTIDLDTVPEHYTAKIEVRDDGTTVITLKYEPGDFVTKSILDQNGKKWSDEICYKWDVVTVRLFAHNNGKNTLYNVTVRDKLPEGASFVLNSEKMSPFDEEAGDFVVITQGRINVNIGVLEPGEKRTITYQAKAYDPTTFADLPAYFDFGNEEPLPLYAPDPARETNTVSPCRLTEPTPVPSSEPNELPKTGFAPNVVTKLPRMSVNYQAYSQLRIRIPKLGVDAEILGVPFENGNWDVTWLGNNVGWLQNTAYPATTGAGNSVLTGHLTNNLGQPSVFSGIERLGYGDQIIITAFGETHTYIVDETMTVYHDTPQVLSQNVDLPVLTLITCKYYNEQTNSYDGRVVVKAKLAGIS